ncbi:hypothetical protein RGR602_PB00343 (plasmid) [Rhizobium gallicum bv. gallicum R602sp]|uniref:Uncharacterized protein n=1 Tax=Rhizobium gallicum bv. gallicum R602sp TaxID=1041138 RepID=A0A0B4XAV9_9HYPH|nr:hypothetical protein RGR602_PB00343 [Rhizobium gallicum bv. gallicum R602sp]
MWWTASAPGIARHRNVPKCGCRKSHEGEPSTTSGQRHLPTARYPRQSSGPACYHLKTEGQITKLKLINDKWTVVGSSICLKLESLE